MMIIDDNDYVGCNDELGDNYIDDCVGSVVMMMMMNLTMIMMMIVVMILLLLRLIMIFKCTSRF